MPVLYSPESAYAKEAVKWEGQYSQYGPPGRPFTFAEFPKRLYRASRPATGGKVTFEGLDVADEDEQRNMQSRGFCIGQDVALDALQREEFSIAQASAERAFSDRRMSDKAQREADEADARTAAHLPEIPEQRRGPRAKGA